MKRSAHKAVFLDRDGTLIHDRPGHYLSRPEDLRLYKHAIPALRLLKKMGFKLFIVSNQSGVARGYFSLKTARAINARLAGLLKQGGAPVAGIAFCPHGPDGRCGCRKPKPQMGNRLIRGHGLDPAASFMIGDKFSDMEFGRALGMKTVLLKTGHGKSQLQKHGKRSEADKITQDILTGAKWIKHEIQNKTDPTNNRAAAAYR